MDGWSRREENLIEKFFLLLQNVISDVSQTSLQDVIYKASLCATLLLPKSRYKIYSFKKSECYNNTPIANTKSDIPTNTI